MTKKEKALIIIELLDKCYPEANKCYLDYDTDKPWQLLFATILSAQCTDNRVNIVTKTLFKKYKTLEDFASATLEEMEEDVRTTGFYRNKAKGIVFSARILLERYSGELPSDINLLIELPSVGRKTANVVRGHIFGIPSIVVDTHVKRVSFRVGLVKSEEPTKVEFELMKILPKEYWIEYNTKVIAHGREICKSLNPRCEICSFNEYCNYFRKRTLG